MAQLVSAPPCHGGGREFKSRQGRKINPKLFGAWGFCFAIYLAPGPVVAHGIGGSAQAAR